MIALRLAVHRTLQVDRAGGTERLQSLAGGKHGDVPVKVGVLE